MSKSVAYLKPKALSSPQVLEYVWASDSNAIIVDLSGSPNVNLNANNPINGLKRLKNDDDTYQNVWSDPSGKLYNFDVSGNDISGAFFPLAFFVANESGSRTLTRVTGSNTQFTLPTFSVVDKLFTDQKGSPYYTSYKTNVPISLQNTPVDISLTTLTGSTFNKSNRDLSFNAFDTSNNKITIDLSGFKFSTTNSYNPAQYDICLNLRTGFQLSSYSVANTDVSNQLFIKLYKFGMGSSNQEIIKYSSVNSQVTTIDLSVNVLNASGVLRFDTSGAGVLAAQTSTLQPNVDFMNLVDLSYSFIKPGRQNISIPITIPASTSGCWIWNAYLVDGNMISTPITVTLKVQPSFTAPIITQDPTTSLTLIPGLGQPASFNIKLDNNAFVPDICNNLTRGMFVYPRINAVNANVPGDVSLNNLNAGLMIKKAGTSYTLVTNDLSTNTLSFADISNGNNALIVRATDISLNPDTGFYFKWPGRDVSTNYTIDASSNDFNLPARKFNLLLDWLPNGQPAAEGIIKPQTSTIGSINVATTYTANVNLVDNKDGSYSLSLTDLNGPLDSASYLIKVFTDANCTTAAPVTTKFTLDSQSNVYSSSSNQFSVEMDSNFNATFTGPKLVTKSDRLYMVAYLVNSTKTYLYTASKPVSVIYAKYPILNVSFDTVNAFVAAELNKIVNINDNLDLNSALSDLSGYRVTGINAGIDLSCNLSLPTWDLVGPNLKFTLNDNNGVVKSMDISANVTKRSNISTNTPSVFTNLSDVSNNLGFYVDLSFNAVKTECLFSLDIALGDAAGNFYPSATKTIVFYYPGTFGTTATNAGGKKNTLIIFNDAKYTLDAVPGLTQMSLQAKDTFDCYTWLAGSSANTYSLNFARSEFMGDGHVIDASGFKIDSVGQTGVTNADPAALYLQFNGSWTTLSTSTVSNYTQVPCVFAKNNYSWIDTRKFVGTIDINYSTKDTNALYSTTLNTLRLVVLPRPTIQASIAVTPNVLINTPSTLQVTLKNAQTNKTGGSITISTWAPTDISGGKNLSGKFRTLLNATSGSISLVNSSGAPDVANAGFFTLPSVGDMLYSNSLIVPVAFKGRPSAGIVSSNIQANYTMNGARAISGSTALQVVVYSSDSTFNNSVYTNNLLTNTQFNFAGMPFVQYVSLDNSNNTINLSTDSRTKNATFVVVENKGSSAASPTWSSGTGNVGYGTTTTNGLTSVSAGSVAVFFHSTTTTWEFLYTKQ